MTSLPEVLIHFRTDLEEAIGREQAARVRRRARRRRAAVLVAVVVAAGTASAIASVRDFPFIESAHGRMWRTVDGVRFSVNAPFGWEARSLYISNNTVPPQDAEAVIFWAGFHDGGEAAPCARLLSAAASGSTADLAAAVARAPGTRSSKALRASLWADAPRSTSYSPFARISVATQGSSSPGTPWVRVRCGTEPMWATRSGYGSSMCTARACSSKPRPSKGPASWSGRSPRSSDQSALSRPNARGVRERLRWQRWGLRRATEQGVACGSPSDPLV